MSRQPDNSYRPLGRRMLDGQRRQKERRVGSIAQRPIVTIYPHSPGDANDAAGLRIEQSCAANATTNIKLLLAAYTYKVEVSYWMKRGAGVWQSGEIVIMLNPSSAAPEMAHTAHRPAGQALGALGTTFTVDVNANVLRLNVVVDNSSGTAVTLRGAYRYIGV